MRAGRIRSKVGSVLLTVLTLIGVIIFLAPFYTCIITSVKTPLETAESVLAFPRYIQWSNFTKAAEVTNFFQSFMNSMITTPLSVFLIVVCSSMAGYIISRNIQKRIYRYSEMVFLAAMMVPFQVIMIPVYRIIKALSLINTLQGAIILMVGTSIPYSTFLYIGFIKTVPRELEEAAIIDGCGLYRTFWQIVFPLLKPITACVATLHVLWMWNEFSIALIVLQRKAVRTIPMQQFFFFGQYTANINAAFASAVLSMIPVLIFFVAAQKFIVQGLTAGAIKG